MRTHLLVEKISLNPIKRMLTGKSMLKAVGNRFLLFPSHKDSSSDVAEGGRRRFIPGRRRLYTVRKPVLVFVYSDVYILLRIKRCGSGEYSPSTRSVPRYKNDHC